MWWAMFKNFCRGGGSPPPLENKKKRWLAIWGGGLFVTFFSMWRPFLLRLWGVGAFSTCMWGPFLTCPPPLRKFLRAPKAPPHSHLSFVKRVVISIFVFDKQFDARMVYFSKIIIHLVQLGDQMLC